MSTISLYQKYRPINFSQVRGQDSVVNTISKQIKNQAIGHAYLFYGSRGLGKTTIARLMAKDLGINDQDLYEIDAASNRGIDDIREIRQGVKARPFSSPFKMYLIDEVHMLTKEAFNALLKTLEEPPSYVIFVMATTELHKVPDTIQSRSQVFTFASPTIDSIADLVQTVASAEGSDLTDEIADSIAHRSHGSYRDALSELQKYISTDSYHDSINDVKSLVNHLLNYLVQPDQSKLPNIISTIQTIPDPKVVYDLLLQQSSELLYEKVLSKNDSAISSKHLKQLLDYRGYFDLSSDLQIQRSGLLILISQLHESYTQENAPN